MSMTLVQKLNEIYIKEGKPGIKRLAGELDVEVITVERWRTCESSPRTSNDVYKLALACGFTDKEAYKFALEAPRTKAKETA